MEWWWWIIVIVALAASGLALIHGRRRHGRVVAVRSGGRR